jgi:hypothetical protein
VAGRVRFGYRGFLGAVELILDLLFGRLDGDLGGSLKTAKRWHSHRTPNKRLGGAA